MAVDVEGTISAMSSNKGIVEEWKTNFIVEDTPPLRIVSGCSVKQIIFVRGKSRGEPAGLRRTERPSGICIKTESESWWIIY